MVKIYEGLKPKNLQIIKLESKQSFLQRSKPKITNISEDKHVLTRKIMNDLRYANITVQIKDRFL